MCRVGTPWKGDGDHIPDDWDVAGVAYVPCRLAFSRPPTYPAAPAAYRPIVVKGTSVTQAPSTPLGYENCSKGEWWSKRKKARIVVKGRLVVKGRIVDAAERLRA